MRLSKLQISGFKSFPDRAELGFDRGVTAIVGPNGCGKSNVVDAITWVLGEQSAKSLRGERMEDVIFNGSDARKPTATAEVRLGLADVAQASFDGSSGRPEQRRGAALGGEPVGDAGDPFLDAGAPVARNVEIGRRLYRSGESEYLLDGEVCRLRDIHDLLMDSGLGVKAYAVIEQGKIGQILSSRPAERRALIEEAAGVTKYKSRRRAAELKLEAARQNLTRIDDIIFEVEKQRGALKRQASRARRYQRLREELRRWEQVQFARRHQGLSGEIEAAEARLADGRTREAGASAHVAALESRLEALRLELSEVEARALQVREEAHARELEIGRCQQQMAFDRQQIEDLGRRAEALAAEADELGTRRAPARAAIEAQDAALVRARTLLDEARAQVEASQTEHAEALAVVQAAERDADQARAAVLASTGTLSALRQARDHAAEARDRVAAERSRLDVETRDLEQEAERVRADRETAAAALAKARDDVETLVRQRETLEQQLATDRIRRDHLTSDLASRQRELAAVEARLHSLEELDHRRATFGDAARLLLDGKASQLRHHGAVADELEVERSYERAVDALLGDLLQHVIVETHEDVEQALGQVAVANAGRCGFVVLGDADAAAPASPQHIGGVRWLTEVVRLKGPHAGAIGPLLGQAAIVESYEAARALAGRVDMPVATMAGDVFRGASRVEGGTRQDARGILEMRGEIESGREDFQTLGKSVHRLANDVFEAGLSVGSGEDDLADRVEAQHTQEKALVGLDARVARLDEDSDAARPPGAGSGDRAAPSDRRRADRGAPSRRGGRHHRRARNAADRRGGQPRGRGRAAAGFSRARRREAARPHRRTHDAGGPW